MRRQSQAENDGQVDLSLFAQALSSQPGAFFSPGFPLRGLRLREKIFLLTKLLLRKLEDGPHLLRKIIIEPGCRGFLITHLAGLALGIGREPPLVLGRCTDAAGILGLLLRLPGRLAGLLPLRPCIKPLRPITGTQPDHERHASDYESKTLHVTSLPHHLGKSSALDTSRVASNIACWQRVRLWTSR